ncbi:PspC domain-containing protein [Brachybacterium sp. NPDC056505]|uniref:ATP-binding protein n=1 Tax=Brachybacterium sp. NPDC056505 TaxID=3345843 RepID=UPI00366DD441
MRTTRIIRPRQHAVAGVCAGLAEHTGLPLAAVRAGACVLTATGGAGALLYVWLWATTPLAGADSPAPRASLTRAASPATAGAAGAEDDQAHGQVRSGPSSRSALGRAPVTEILLGLALLLAGGAMVASRLGAQIPLAFFVPAVFVLIGAGLAWRQLHELRIGRASGPSAQVARVAGALALVVLGILLFFVSDAEPNVWTVFVAATSVLLGVGVVLAPWAVRLVRDLAEERAARAREVERAEFAAHLHDSVLQTLALIQQKAEPGSEASRLARGQERELRSWLFAETAGSGTAGPLDLAAELRRAAMQCEQEHAVRIDVVTTGRAVPEAPEGLLAAAREAMLNAARHAGGTISVYSEASDGMLEVTVSDRGPGFDLASIGPERLGVRESIIGRMRRLGGSARIQPGPGGTGTRVVLRLPRAQGAGETERSTAASAPTTTVPSPQEHR